MQPKSIATIALLGFVVLSVAVLVAKQTRRAASDTRPPGPGNAAVADSPGAAQRRVVAYMFHGNVRCVTCVAIEEHARQALEEAFADQLASGQLEWRVVNYDEPGNEHFIFDYQLTAPSVVLVLMEGDRQLKWKNLSEVWEYVGDWPALFKLIQDSTRAFLQEAAGSDTARCWPAAPLRATAYQAREAGYG